MKIKKIHNTGDYLVIENCFALILLYYGQFFFLKTPPDHCKPIINSSTSITINCVNNNKIKHDT